MDGKVGIGHPDPKHPSNQMSEGDKKVFDYDGRKVVDKAPWGSQGTGLYLTIFGTTLLRTHLSPNRKFHFETLELPSGIEITVGASHGKPTFKTPGYGASLELPEDLARDEAKKQYVLEWSVATTQEILGSAKKGIPDHQLDAFANWLIVTADKAIRKTGL